MFKCFTKKVVVRMLSDRPGEVGAHVTPDKSISDLVRDYFKGNAWQSVTGIIYWSGSGRSPGVVTFKFKETECRLNRAV